MHRRKLVLAGVAAFAIGAAFAAQPVSVRADRGSNEPAQSAKVGRVERSSWAPGTNGVMAAYEPDTLLVAPPQ